MGGEDRGDRLQVDEDDSRQPLKLCAGRAQGGMKMQSALPGAESATITGAQGRFASRSSSAMASSRSSLSHLTRHRDAGGLAAAASSLAV